MNSTMREMFEKSDIKFNKELMEGLSRKYLDRIVDHLDAVIRSGVATLQPDIPLIYHGWRRLTPREDFKNNVESSMSKNIIDISRNYLFKVEFGLEYEGIRINRVISLPYVDRGGYIKLSDADYVIVPVLSEYPISPAPGELFIRLLRDKLNIKKMDRNILINGEKKSRQILYSKSYKLLKNVNDVIPIAIYMFIKHGFYGVFKKYFNTEPRLMINDGTLNFSSIIEEYNVYQSTGMKPRNLNAVNYIPHNVVILVKREDVTPFMEIVINSIIYAFDMSPQFANNIIKVAGKKKLPNTQFSFSDIDEESLFWITLLGKIVFKNKFSIDRVQADMMEHIDILNGYMDDIIKEKLREISINIDDFYELIAWVLEHFHDLVLTHEEYSSKLNNRYIEVLYYILFDLIVGINKAFLEFKRTASRKKLSEKEINRLFNKYLSTKKIFSLIKSGVNIAIAPVDYSSDNLYFKMTSILEDCNWFSINLVNCGNTVKPIDTTCNWKQITALAPVMEVASTVKTL